MNTKAAITIAAAWAASSALAQLPGKPEENGLPPASDTFYINTPGTLFNASTHSLGVAIARNGNVLFGWQDDGDGIRDLKAVWTLYSPTAQSLTADTAVHSDNADFAGDDTITTKFLSYFRADGSPIPGWASLSPKIKANLFGEGLGMGAASFEIDKEIIELAPFQRTDGGDNAGDFPTVQLLTNAGGPSGIVSGVPAEYAERDGDIRIADWDYLSTGNLVVVSESRQGEDLVDLYGGSDPDNHAIMRLVSPAGAEVKAVQLVSAVAETSEVWHGVGVTREGFAVRWAAANERATVRFFDNTGAATSTNVDLGTLAGNEILAAGGRGDQVGFHGNGNDAYAAIAQGTAGDGTRQVWVAVLDGKGTPRWARSVSDDLTLVNPDHCDVAINEAGRVVAVYDDPVSTGGNARQVLGRIFDAAGTPEGGTFYVSERELPATTTRQSQNPRVAFRGDSVAITWESQNSGATEESVVAGRLFALKHVEGFALGVPVAGTDTVTLSWTGGTGPFLVQGRMAINGASWTDLVTTSDHSATIPLVGGGMFLRVQDGGTKTVKLFKAVLNGANERPTQVVTPATGVGLLALDGTTATYVVSYSGLTAASSAAHVHGPATADEAKGVMFAIDGPIGPTAGLFSGVKTGLTAAQVTAIETGLSYFNIHTVGPNAGGEIRGQILAP